MTPGNITALPEEKLRESGLSRPKATYLLDLSRKVLDGTIDLEVTGSMDDGEVIGSLTTVKGIGRWTAEMFLIFSLGRPDVFSAGDLGLKKAVAWLYGLEDLPGGARLEELSRSWRPYRTEASLYLWEALNRGLTVGTNDETEGGL